MAVLPFMRYKDKLTGQWEIAKTDTIVKEDGSLKYTPDDIKGIENKIDILSGASGTKEKANKEDFDAHKAEKATHDELGHIKLSDIPSVVTDSGREVKEVVFGIKQNLEKVTSRSDSFSSLSNLESDASFIYCASSGNDRKVIKLNKANFKVVAESHDLLGNLQYINLDGNYVYITVRFSDFGKVYKLNKASLEIVAESPNLKNQLSHVTGDDDYIYTGTVYSNSGTIYKLNKSNLDVVAESEDFGKAIGHIAVDDTHIYCVNEGSVRKLDKGTLEKVTMKSWGDSHRVHTLILDDDYVYTFTGGSVMRLSKLAKSNLSKVSDKDYTSIITVLATDEDYLYVGFQATMQKLRRDTLDVVSEYKYDKNIYDILIDDVSFYFSNYSSIARIGEITLGNIILGGTI